MTTISDPITDALATLGLAELPDAETLKKAYRKETLKHPPDVDADGFQRVRAAFELLQNPFEGARRAVAHGWPHAPPPRFTAAVDDGRGALSMRLLRASMMRVSARDLLAGK